MEIGLYNAKYPFRKLFNFLLPYFKDTDPNWVSIALIPLGLITAWIYYVGSDNSLLLVLGIVLIFLRMIIGTLDGMIAERFNKQTPNGNILNRLAPECADIFLILAIIFSNSDYHTLGFWVLAVCWGISYCGLIGLVGNKPIQSIGPVGQTDKVVALILFSLLQIFSLIWNWGVDFIYWFLWWVLIGGVVTIIIRCYRILRN